MLKKLILTSSTLAVGLWAFTANANTIVDFESYSTGNLSNTENIGGVIFSVTNPTASTTLRIFNDYGPRTAYILSCDISAGFNCNQNMTVNFGASVTNLSFDFLAEDLGAGLTSGTVSAYLNGGLLGSMNLISDGNGDSHNTVDLSAFGSIDQLVLTSAADPAGLGYDNFSFNVVPVPAAIWLFGSGLLGLIGVGSRRKKV